MKAMIEAIKAPHDNLHTSAITINNALSAGNRAQVETTYLTETLPALEKIETFFKSLIFAEDQLREAQSKAISIFDTHTLPAFNKTAGALGHDNA
jgi:methyl-accepting chemotaxis protein